MKIILPEAARALIEAKLPANVDTFWFRDVGQVQEVIRDADIAWVDSSDKPGMRRAILATGAGLKWLSTIYAGLDSFPLEHLRKNNVIVTNGAGVNAVAVAEYAVMAVIVAAKRFDEVLRAFDRSEWLKTPPGRVEVDGSKALIIGYGTIGRLIGDRLTAFGAGVTGVTRSGGGNTLTPDAWRDRLAEFDWIVLAAPSTDQTKALIGPHELSKMKQDAWIINIARGDMIDNDALVSALRSGRLGGAVLDPTDPEPLPQGHPLWTAPNTIVTMHLSGQSQTKMFQHASELFLENLDAYLHGQPMTNVADLAAGY